MIDNTTSDSLRRYYYAQDEAVIGPMPLAALQALWKAGELSVDTLAVEEGSEAWRPLSDVLQAAAAKPMPPALPTVINSGQAKTANTESAKGCGVLSAGFVGNALASQTEEWYERPILVFAGLFLCFPVGLAFLWKSRHFSQLMRIGWTAVVVLFFGAWQLGRLDSNAVSSRKRDKDAVNEIKGQSEPSSTAEDKQSEALEYKLACLDAGHAISKFAPELREYKRVIEELAARFDITQDRVGGMVHALVKSLHDDDQITVTRLGMLLAAEKTTAGGNAKMFGKGDQALSSAFAAIATLMIDGRQKGSRDDAASSMAQGERVVLRDTAFYADKETVELIEAAWDRGDAAGEAAFERMEREGKTWMEPYDLHVAILERGGPRESVLVQAYGGGKGLRATRFWVFESDLLPMSNPAAKWAADKSKAVSKARFSHVLDGEKPHEIGAVTILNFIEFIAGLYEGTIPDAAAKKCLVMRESIGGTNPCDFQQVLADHLIYEGVLTVREHFQFALIRERAFEEGYADPMQLYKEVEGSGHHSGNPLYKGALVFEGKREFATRTGLVRQIPVFRVVNVQP
jgi:hypothetical protein